MNLIELSNEYRTSGQLCKTRIKEINELLASDIISEKERLILKRRLTVLTAMARDAIHTANRLANYYREVE